MSMGSPEGVDFNDPLSILLMQEHEDGEADALHEQWLAGLHRAKTVEVERSYDEPEPVAHRNWVEH